MMSIDEAKAKSATGKRALILQEYLGYIEQLEQGKACKLTPGEGESVGMVRRRLGAAAKAFGEDVVIKRAGDEVYFWLKGTPRQRRGRPRKTSG
jgi:hypothetical protein